MLTLCPHVCTELDRGLDTFGRQTLSAVERQSLGLCMSAYDRVNS